MIHKCKYLVKLIRKGVETIALRLNTSCTLNESHTMRCTKHRNHVYAISDDAIVNNTILGFAILKDAKLTDVILGDVIL